MKPLTHLLQLATAAAFVAMPAVHLFAQGINDSYSQAVASENPILYYRFGGSTPTSAINLGSAGESFNLASSGSFLNQATAPLPPIYDGFYAGNESAYFSSPGHYLTGSANALHPLLNDLDGLTVSFWVYRGTEDYSTASKPVFFLPVPNTAGTAATQGLAVYLRQNGVSLVARTPDNANVGNSTAWWNDNATPTVPLGEWVHVTLVADFVEKTASLYVNGAEYGSSISPSAWGDGGMNMQSFTGDLIHTPFTLGQSVNTDGTVGGNHLLDNFIDEFSLHGSAFSAADVAALYASAFTPVPEPASLALLALAAVAGIAVRVRLARD